MAQAQAQQQAQGMAQQMQNQQNQSGQQSGNQTPVTPSTAGGPGQTQNASQNNAPLNPGGESREKERVSLLLDINKYLLMEVMKLQDAQAAAKAAKEAAEGEKEKSKVTVDPGMGKEFVECMRRIQYNLSYLAAIADRSHKPSSQTPPHPAIISAPQLESIKRMKAAKKEEAKKEDSGTIKSEEEKKGENEEEEEEDGPEELKKMYAQLQTLFPGVDPRKEPPVPQQGGMKPQQHQPTQNGTPTTSAPTPGTPAQQRAGGTPQDVQNPNPQAMQHQAMQKQFTQTSAQQGTQQGTAPSNSTPAGPGATGFGSGGINTPIATPQQIPGGLANMTPEQRMAMMQQMQSRQQAPQLQAQMMQAPNRDFSPAQGGMGFGSGAMGNQNPNHIGLGGGSMGAGPGGGGLPGQSALSQPGGSVGMMGGGGMGMGTTGGSGGPAGAGGGNGAMSMASNENRARMMTQMQAQMQGMTPQQRIEVMKSMGVSAGVIGAIGGRAHLRQNSQVGQGGQGGMQGGQNLGGGNMGGQQGMGMGGGMYRQ